jgi:hypothetical protein
MCLREKFRNYRPNLATPVNDLGGKEVLRQFLYLESGLADVTDRRGVSFGLAPQLTDRRNELLAHIEGALEASFA